MLQRFPAESILCHLCQSTSAYIMSLGVSLLEITLLSSEMTMELASVLLAHMLEVALDEQWV
jgi:hypothetical protein